LPYIDSSIDIVAVASDDPLVLAEANRVASLAVLNFASAELQVNWLAARKPRSAATNASIIIPCFNQASVTEACLRTLAETLPRDLDLEIIVVDDASTDQTPHLLQKWADGGRSESRHVLRNRTNSGFIKSCNRGAQAASGDLLVFLNNDTLPLPGWLEAIVQVFSDKPDAGAVGARLLYPDGRLQEAGGVVFADGSAANVGRGEYDADQPLFNFVREVDYCSGAALATPRALFESIGGFDARYAPAYYEDTDYCLAVRARGERVYYQPRCVIVHREGVSSGTDLASGVKRFQALNQAKSARK